MNLLDRHIFKSVLGSCAAAVAMFSFILILGNVIRDLLGNVLTGQLSAMKFIELTALITPYAASYALPLGMLTGVLLTLGRLSADSEITAMRAAGISMPRIARPVIFLAVLGGAGALWINFVSMPHAKVKYENELTEALRANPIGFIIPRTFIRTFPGYVLYIGSKENGTLKDFWLWQLDSQRRAIRFVRAEGGTLGYDEGTDQLILTLDNGQVETMPNERDPEDFSQAPPIATFVVSDPVHLSLASIFGHAPDRKKLAWMTYRELKGRVGLDEALKEEKGDLRQARMKVAITIQEKFTTAFAVLSFALIGIPLGIRISRRETSANLGVAVSLALGYYFLTVLLSWLDKHPEYHPDFLIWVPNLLLVWTAFALFRRLRTL